MRRQKRTSSKRRPCWEGSARRVLSWKVSVGFWAKLIATSTRTVIKTKKHKVISNSIDDKCLPFELTEEAHAELIYAEVQVMLTLLSFGETSSILSLIKGAFRLRAANNAFKLTAQILEKKTSWTSAIARREFDAGVSTGTGIINLVSSSIQSQSIDRSLY